MEVMDEKDKMLYSWSYDDGPRVCAPPVFEIVKIEKLPDCNATVLDLNKEE